MSLWKKLQNKSMFFFIISLLTLSIFCIPAVEAQETDTVAVDVIIWIKILNINESNKVVEYQFTGFVEGILDNESDVSFNVQSESIRCEPQKSDNGWTYRCETETLSMKLAGQGEFFPFEQYAQTIHIYLYLDELNFFKKIDYEYNLTTGDNSAWFGGLDSEILEDTWKTNENGRLPITPTEDSIIITYERTTDKTLLYFLEFFVPILACYFLMGASLLLKPDQLSERMAIYISLFVFIPPFLFSIQDYLPYHTSFTFPEFLLINLIISTAIFAIFSIMSKTKNLKQNQNSIIEENINTRKWDFWGSIIAFCLFYILYLSLFFSEFYSFVQYSQLDYEFVYVGLLSYSVIHSFFFWIPGVFMTKTWKKTYSKILGQFALFFLLTILAYIIIFGFLPTFSLNLFQLYPIVALVYGGLIRLKQDSNIKSAIIATLSGTMGTIYAGVIFYFVSLICQKIFFVQLMLISGGLGLTFGLFALVGVLITGILKLLVLSVYNKIKKIKFI